MVYLGSHTRTRLPIGLHGALIPIFGAPLLAFGGSCLGMIALGPHGVTYFQAILVPYALIAPCFLAALVAYYLVWKYIVGTLNRVMEIA